ncbi:MAG: peptidylprolyl isomerase [Pseudomonadota bacterium]
MKRLAHRVLVFLAAFALGSGPARGEIVDRIAAVVNNDVITWSEVYDLGGQHIEERLAAGQGGSRRSLEIEVLDALIGQKLVEQEIERLDLDVTDQDRERALSDIARQNGIERDRLQAEVESSGLPWSEYLQQLDQNLRDMKFNQQVLAPRIVIREDELRDAYRRNLDSLAGPERAHLRAILLPFPEGADDAAREAVLAQAHALRAEVGAGAAFADLCVERSAEPYASRGCELGTFRQGELVGDLDRAAFSVPAGAVAEPVVAPQGVFLVLVEERSRPPAPEYEQVEQQLRGRLTEARYQEAREQWLVQARRRVAVKVLLEPE